MAITARCCNKDHKNGLRKCPYCGKGLIKFIVKVKDNSTGKWRTQTVSSLKLAKEIENKFKTDLIENRLFDKKKDSSLSFAKYIIYSKLHKKTWRDDELRWNKHVAGNNFRTKQGILNILKNMQESNYKPATVHHVLKLIKRVYNWSILHGFFFQENPCNSITLQKYDNSINNILSKDQITNLVKYLNTWDNVRASSVILFALYSGRRKGEIINLKWNDVCFDNCTITCRNTKNGLTQSFPVNQKALSVLRTAQSIKISDYVFPSSNGKYYYNGFNLAWNRLKHRINLLIRFHDIRHTYASHLASSNRVDIYTLKNLLGHKDINLTMRYSHLINNVVKNANNVIDDIF